MNLHHNLIVQTQFGVERFFNLILRNENENQFSLFSILVVRRKNYAYFCNLFIFPCLKKKKKIHTYTHDKIICK